MVKKWIKVLVIALGLATFAGTSEAALTAVDPGPYTAATGFFPLWYTDSTNTTLDLCLSKAVSSRVAGAPGAPSYMCTLLPNPGIFDDALPIVFPYNFPDEAFWFTGDAAIVGSGIDLQYGAALEAAFGGGVPAPGDQVSFARIRIRVDVTVAGTYTVTHPYGVETFIVTTPGRRAINMTRDIGIGAPGIFTGALNGDIGPFLRRAAGPYTETNPVTGALETFIGDPNLLELVTGSPFGTNFVRIQGPGIDLQTDLFAVSGRIWNNKVPTAVNVDRSTYTRTPAGVTGIEVFAATTPTATVTFRETLPLGTEFPMTGDGAGNYFAQDPAAATLPPYVIVTATDTTTTPTALASPLVDVVKITQALYSQADQTLVIQAKSSDEQAPIPTLRVLGLQGTLQSASGTTTQQLFVSGVTEPPATVTVKSSAGGSDTEPVVVVPVANANPVAVDDSATTDQGVAVTINVLANDTDPDGNVPLAVDSVTQPANGSVVNNGISVTYTPPNATFSGTTTFTYQARDNRGGLSNAATVTVTVRAPNQLPVARNDSATTSQAQAVTINVLANDTDADGDTPLAVANLTTPANGTASISGTSVIYTPRAGFAGTDSFTYQAQDTRGGLSNAATVTVTVTNAAPVANPDTATTTAGVPVNIAVLANDNDPDGNTPLTVTNLNQPANGTAVLQGNNTVTYTSNGGFTGTDSFTYQARDTLGALSNAATVTVTVNAAAVDLNITGFSTTGTVRLSRNQSVAITLRVRNIGAVNGSVPATVVGVQNGAQIYSVTQQVNDPPGGGSTSFNFPAHLPSAVGNINWTVTVQDTNPSSATATTNVRP